MGPDSARLSESLSILGHAHPPTCPTPHQIHAIHGHRHRLCNTALMRYEEGVGRGKVPLAERPGRQSTARETPPP